MKFFIVLLFPDFHLPADIISLLISAAVLNTGVCLLLYQTVPSYSAMKGNEPLKHCLNCVLHFVSYLRVIFLTKSQWFDFISENSIVRCWDKSLLSQTGKEKHPSYLPTPRNRHSSLILPTPPQKPPQTRMTLFSTFCASLYLSSWVPLTLVFFFLLIIQNSLPVNWLFASSLDLWLTWLYLILLTIFKQKAFIVKVCVRADPYPNSKQVFSVNNTTSVIHTVIKYPATLT